MWKSLWLFMWGILRRAYLWIPSIWFDPFQIYSEGIKPNLPPDYRWDIEMPSEWFPLVFGALVFWTAVLTYHELRRSSGHENIEYTIRLLRNYHIDFGIETKSLAWLVKIFDNQLSHGVHESTLIDIMKKIEARRDPQLIFGELQKLNLIKIDRIDPAPGSASAVRRSIHDMPYNFYTWSDFGKRVVLKLPSVSNARYYDATNSLYSRFSALTSSLMVSLKRKGLLRLLKHHSAPSN